MINTQKQLLEQICVWMISTRSLKETQSGRPCCYELFGLPTSNINCRFIQMLWSGPAQPVQLSIHFHFFKVLLSPQPSSVVFSALLIFMLRKDGTWRKYLCHVWSDDRVSPSPVLPSIPSLWPLVVWGVWGLGPALLTLLSETVSFHSSPFHRAKSPPFPHSLPGKLILWWTDWGTDCLTCWQSECLQGSANGLTQQEPDWLTGLLFSVNDWLTSQLLMLKRRHVHRS